MQPETFGDTSLQVEHLPHDRVLYPTDGFVTLSANNLVNLILQFASNIRVCQY